MPLQINKYSFRVFTGGSTLYIESVKADPIVKDDGSPSIELTGHLGDVMKESVRIALTVAKNYLAAVDPGNQFLHKNRIHVHFPEVSCLTIESLFVKEGYSIQRNYGRKHVRQFPVYI